MKEATGELNMTVVTLIAIAAIAALFYFAIWPMIQQMLVQQTCNTYGPDYKAVKGATAHVQGQAEVDFWCCCKGNKNQCVETDNDCVVVKGQGTQPTQEAPAGTGIRSN